MINQENNKDRENLVRKFNIILSMKKVVVCSNYLCGIYNMSYDKLIKLPKDVRGKMAYIELRDKIVDDVKRFVTLTGPSSLYLIKRIGILIETYAKKKDKIDKLNLLIDIVKTIYPEVTDSEITFIRNSVEFLLQQKQIRAIPLLKFALNLFEELIKKSCPIFLELGPTLLSKI